jgi:hypothetical protein
MIDSVSSGTHNRRPKLMTVHERSISASVDPKLDRLAELAIKVGLQLKAGQDLAA